MARKSSKDKFCSIGPKRSACVKSLKNPNFKRAKILSQHDDSRNEKSLHVLEQVLTKREQIAIFHPKLHPELDQIEHVWVQLKRYTRGHCEYNVITLKKMFPTHMNRFT